MLTFRRCNVMRSRDCQTALIDVNNLKFLNDKHGHSIGDEALKGLALELKNNAGPDFVVTRIGGDEFGVVLPVNYDTLFVRRVRVHFESGITCSIGPAQHLIFVSASVGFALFPDDGHDSRRSFQSSRQIDVRASAARRSLSRQSEQRFGMSLKRVRSAKAGRSSGCKFGPATAQPEATGAVMEVTKWLIRRTRPAGQVHA